MTRRRNSSAPPKAHTARQRAGRKRVSLRRTAKSGARHMPARRRPRRVPGLVLILRGPFWHIVGTYHRVRVRVSTRETDRILAERALALQMAAIQRAKDGVAGPIRRTLHEAVDAYLAAKERSPHTVKRIEKLKIAVDSTVHCDEVNQGLLNELRKKMLGNKSSEASFKREVLTPIRAVTNFAAAEWGAREGCSVPVFRKIPEGKRRTVTLLPSQASEVVAEAERRGLFALAAVVQIGVCEGLRRGELYNLDWIEVDTQRGRLRARETKARHGDVVDREISDLRPRTLAVLIRLKGGGEKKRGPVLCKDNGGRWASTESFGSEMNRRLKEVGKAVGLPDNVTLHVLRHTAASWHHKVQPDLEEVQARMQWSSINSTHRYVHLLKSATADEVRDFWGLSQL